ncbi:S1C family serine protease [Nocardioides cheoyonin]|uniref:S1C family serine protease n=1 Tax=Nocardioides cheoyonin TaxID=3156615 RepID=UPI0032B3383E
MNEFPSRGDSQGDNETGRPAESSPGPSSDDAARGSERASQGGSAGEPTAPLWTPPSAPRAQGPYAGNLGPQSPPPSALYGPPATQVMPAKPRKQRGLGLAAGVVAAALVVGGGAGIGGAALYTSQHDNSGDIASSSGATSSQVVDEAAPKGSVEKVAARVLPSVVKIEVSGQTEAGSGSGIILSSDGEILTNNHVVEVAGDNGTIKVDFNNGQSANASILGTDPLTDTAVIKAQGVSGLTPATIGKSSKLVVGQSVVAIGSPFGLDSTVTSGIVSALNRPVNVGSDNQGNATVYPAVQTDAAINPGNSGGPLVDLNGNVVGINASIRTSGSSDSEESGSIGLGFAIPIDEVMPIVDQMIKGETPTHARLGISVSTAGVSAQDQSESDITDGDGAKVEQVNQGSAAEDAGMSEGDVITKVGDQPITSSDSLVATIRAYRPGDKVTVTWTHDGKTKSATITLDSDEGSSTS